MAMQLFLVASCPGKRQPLRGQELVNGYRQQYVGPAGPTPRPGAKDLLSRAFRAPRNKMCPGAFRILCPEAGPEVVDVGVQMAWFLPKASDKDGAKPAAKHNHCF